MRRLVTLLAVGLVITSCGPDSGPPSGEEGGVERTAPDTSPPSGASTVQRKDTLVSSGGVGVTETLAGEPRAGLSENTPPTVEIVNPSGGGFDTGSLEIIAQATSDSGVSQVEFFVDGVSVGLGTAAAAPYFYVTWDATGAALGAHTLTAVATDVDGNAATSSPVTIAVDHAPPTLAITSPSPGATFTGILPLRVDTTDDVGVVWVNYYWDGVWLTAAPPPFSVDWDVGAEAGGSHTLEAVALDAAYHTASSTISVNTQQPVSAEYDSSLRAPLCATLSSFCDTTNRVKGLGDWEPHSPNTLQSTCRDGLIDRLDGSRISRLKVSTVSGGLLGTGERVRVEAYVNAENDDYVDLFTTSDADPPSWTWLATFHTDSDSSYQMLPQVFSAEYVLPTGKRQAVRAQIRDGSSSSLTPCSSGARDDRDDVAFAVESAPAVRLTAPSNNANLKGGVSLAATIDDFLHPVTKVEFYDGSTLLGTSTSAPYTLSWNTVGAADGVHSLSAKAYDTVGRNSATPPVEVTIDNTPPDVALISPTQGALLQGDVELQAIATDTVSTYIPKLEFYDGTTLLGTTYCASCEWTWDSSTVTDGTHSLTVKAYDLHGNVGTSTAVVVRVDNTNPTVVLTNPPSQGIVYVRGVLQLSATASDDSGIARVEFYRDSDTLLGTDTSAPYEVSWNSASVADGTHSFFARAYDAAGNTMPSGWSIVTVDNTPSTVALTSPSQGAFVRGTVTLQAAMSDNMYVTLLEFYDGATLIDSAFGGRTAVAWNTVGATEGAHSITVKAYDRAGNVTTSAAVEVRVDNTKPVVALSAPAQGASVHGTVQVSATASDNQALTRVEFYAGTTLLGTATTAPYSVSWNTAGGADGAMTLTSKAYDAAGNVTVSASRTVTVDNVAPTVAITSPANGASFSVLSLSTTVQASASDIVGVAQVVFYDGATVLGTDTTAPYSVNWTLLTAGKGTHTLTARAYDASGNMTLSAPVSVTVK